MPGLKNNIFNCSLCFAIPFFDFTLTVATFYNICFPTYLSFGKKQTSIQFSCIIIIIMILVIKIPVWFHSILPWCGNHLPHVCRVLLCNEAFCFPFLSFIRISLSEVKLKTLQVSECFVKCSIIFYPVNKCLAHPIYSEPPLQRD